MCFTRRHWARRFAPGIAASPFNVAPERETDLRRIRDDKGLRIDFVEDEPGFHLKTTVHDGRISFGIRTIERMWAYSYGYFALVQALQRDQASGRPLDLVGDPQLRDAMTLLDWAYKRERKKTDDPWPNTAPVPHPSPVKGSLSFGANETFFMMAGWMLLHEIGHIVFAHPVALGEPSCELIAQEKEADDWAFAWMLDNWKDYQGDDARIFAKRTIGIALGLSIFTSLEVYDRTYGDGTHPDPPERLYRFLNRWVPKDGARGASYDFAWFVAIAVLKLHFDNNGVTMEPKHIYDSAAECAADMLVIVASRKQG